MELRSQSGEGAKLAFTAAGYALMQTALALCLRDNLYRCI